MRRDLEALLDGIRTRHESVGLNVLPAAGEADAVLDAIGTWLSGQA